MVYSTWQIISVVSRPSPLCIGRNSKTFVTFRSGANPVPVSTRRLKGSISLTFQTESVFRGGAERVVAFALFQWGWLSDITGVQPAPIEPWAPMMLFAIVFGLSMDYEVFLLSRMKEEWDRTHENADRKSVV